jgi:threonyl-tRNA synthetase
MGILVEHTAGAFPAWLAPTQVAILPITDRANAFATEVASRAKALGLRAELDARNESLKAKIRDAQLAKIPYMLVIGDREAEAGTVSVRHRHRGDLGVQPLETFLANLAQEVQSRQR